MCLVFSRHMLDWMCCGVLAHIGTKGTEILFAKYLSAAGDHSFAVSTRFTHTCKLTLHLIRLQRLWKVPRYSRHRWQQKVIKSLNDSAEGHQDGWGWSIWCRKCCWVNYFFCLRKGRQREDLIAAFSYLMSGYKKVETILCLEVHSERTRGNGQNRNSK